LSLGLFDLPEQKEETPSDPIIKYLENFLTLGNLRYEELTVSVVEENGEKFLSYIFLFRNNKRITGLISDQKMVESIGIGKAEIIQSFIDKGSNVPGHSTPKLARRIR